MESDSTVWSRYLTSFNSLTGASVGLSEETEVSLSDEISISAVPTITSVTLTATSALNRTSDNLSASISGLSAGANVTYNWYVNGTSITVLNMPMTNASWSPDAQTTYDFSGYNNNGTLGTNLLADLAEPNYTVSCVIGGCYVFDGINDSINVGNASSLNFLSNESFSISLWFKTSDTGNDFIGKSSGTDIQGYQFYQGSNSDELSFAIGDGTNVPLITTSGLNLSNGLWHQAMAVRDVDSDRLFIYVDGEIKKSGTDTTTKNLTPAVNLLIGQKISSSTAYFNGSMDEVRIYKRALSYEQAKVLYVTEGTQFANNLTEARETLIGQAWNVSATPIDSMGLNGSTYFSTNLINIAAINNTAPTITSASISPSNPTTADNLTANVSSLTDANGDDITVTYNWYVNGTSITVLNLPFTSHLYSSNESYTEDYSSNNNAGFLGYAGIGDPFEPVFTQNCTICSCYTFDGVDDFISAGNASSLNFLSNESFSISLWFKTSDTGNDFIGKSSGTDIQGYQFYQGSNSDELSFAIGDGTNVPLITTSGLNLSNGLWHQAMAVRDVDSDRLFIYVDGEIKKSGTDTTTKNLTLAVNLLIGQKISSSTAYFNGSMDEVRIYKRALSYEQAKVLYVTEGTQFANNLTEARETLIGQAWNVSATPIDSMGLNGSTYFSTNLINIAAINNTAPTITSTSITPANPTTSDNLTANVSSLTDANGDDITVTYNWYVNGTSITVLNLPFTSHLYSSNESYTEDYSSNNNAGFLGYAGIGDPFEPVFTQNCTIGSCYTFDGVDDFISAGNASSLNFLSNESFSISLWFKTSDTGNDFIGKSSGTDIQGYQFYQGSNSDELSFAIGDGTNVPLITTSGLNLSNGLWHQAMAVRDVDSDRLFVYVDGVLKQNAADTTTKNLTPAVNLLIGQKISSSTAYFNGSMDEVRIYRRALSPSEVARLNLSESINHTNNIIVLNETLAGDIWNATATPIDARGMNGSTLWSQRVRINDTLPVIVLYLPVNATTFSVFQPVIFNFTVIDDYDTTFNCNLTLNSAVNQTNSSVGNSTFTLFNVSITSGASHNWSVSCADSFHANTSV